jgi:hypothetical protein
MYHPPLDAPPPKSIDLRAYCQPQSAMLRLWNVPKQGSTLRYFIMYVCALLVGVASLVAAAVITVREAQRVPAGELTPHPHAAQLRAK